MGIKKKKNLCVPHERFEISTPGLQDQRSVGRAWLPSSRGLKGSTALIEILESSFFHGKDINTLKASYIK